MSSTMQSKIVRHAWDISDNEDLSSIPLAYLDQLYFFIYSETLKTPVSKFSNSTIYETLSE